MNSLLKKAIAEAIGTFVLVFCACGTAAWTGGSVTATSLAFGLTIVAMAYSIGRISGCHINPAVSLGCLVAKRMTVKEFLVYVCAQVVGGLVGAFLLFGIAKMSGLVLGGDACNNVVGYTGKLADAGVGNYIGAVLTEVVLTCIFVYVILNVTDDSATEGDEYKRGTAQIAGILIGLTLTLVHLVGIGLTGTSVNPARSVATAVGTAVFNGNLDPLKEIWIFIVAPLAGGALAAVVYGLLHKEEKEA